jgi:hypothetical protein
VAVRPEAEMNEVEHRRRARHLLQCAGVLLGRAFKLPRFDRHRMDVIGCERRMIEQAVAQMREVTVRIAHGGNALVDLKHVHLTPGKRVGRQCAQHQPGRAAAAHRHEEASARCHRRARGVRNDRRRPAGDAIVIGINFDLHDALRIRGAALLHVCVQDALFSRWPPNS